VRARHWRTRSGEKRRAAAEEACIDRRQQRALNGRNESALDELPRLKLNRQNDTRHQVRRDQANGAVRGKTRGRLRPVFIGIAGLAVLAARSTGRRAGNGNSSARVAGNDQASPDEPEQSEDEPKATASHHVKRNADDATNARRQVAHVNNQPESA